MQLSIEPNDKVGFKLRHEDEDLLVVEKPPHVVTAPGLAHEHDSLMNGLFAQYGAQLQNLGKQRDFGLLHRLDRETSGLVVVALKPSVYDAMRAMFESRSIAKFYWAIVKGAPNKPTGVIKRPIAEYQGSPKGGGGNSAGVRGETGRMKLARISSAGKPAVTAYRTIETSVLGSMLECRAVTGRLHQIRVHLASIGSPIVGDTYYANASVRSAAPRLALHAHRIAFKHPTTGAEIDARSPFPKDLRNLLVRLNLKRPDIEAAPGGDSALDAAADTGHEIGGDAIGDEDAGVVE